VLLLGQFVRQLAKLALQLVTDLGIEVDNLLTKLGDLAVILTVQLVVPLPELVSHLGVDLRDLVADFILDLVNLALEESNLVQQLVLQRLALAHWFNAVASSIGSGGDWLSKRNGYVTANLFGGSRAFLGVLGAADALVGHGTSSVLERGADLARMSLALAFFNRLTLGLVVARLLPNQVAVGNGQDGTLVLHGQPAALLILDAAFALLNR